MSLLNCDRICSMSVKKYLNKLEDLTGQKIIVTGGTSGIGLSIVKELLYKGANVVILARNLNKANEVKASLEEQYPDKAIDIVEYDQSNDESIIKAVDVILFQKLYPTPPDFIPTPRAR